MQFGECCVNALFAFGIQTRYAVELFAIGAHALFEASWIRRDKDTSLVSLVIEQKRGCARQLGRTRVGGVDTLLLPVCAGCAAASVRLLAAIVQTLRLSEFARRVSHRPVETASFANEGSLLL